MLVLGTAECVNLSNVLLLKLKKYIYLGKLYLPTIVILYTQLVYIIKGNPKNSHEKVFKKRI
jgi:hypothetical protein